MGRFNEILVGRHNRLAQKLHSMKGPASLATLSDELFHVISQFHGAENRYLEAWDRFGLTINVTAVAAQFSQCRLRNPVGSNVIAVVEKALVLEITATGSAVLAVNTVSTDYTSVFATSTQRFDSRGRTAPTCIASTQTAAAQTGVVVASVGLAGANSSADFIITDIQELPLLPGSSFDMQGNVVNQQLQFTFWWRERYLEESERT